MNRLRDQPDDLFALISGTSESTGLPPAFVEKDFWITELLRAVVVAASSEGATAVFKGGTSLSKAYGLIERFSEDVDILLVPPGDLGQEARHSVLRHICEQAAEHLGIEPVRVEVVHSTTGIKRDVRYPYPRRFEAGPLSEGVLLEMGIRGGPDPRAAVEMISLVTTHAFEHHGATEQDFQEFHPVTVEVLAPHRTLVEKLSLLHGLASRLPNRDAVEGLARAGRHYYDIHNLLHHQPVLEACSIPGCVEELAADVGRHSAKHRWPFTPRPSAGYSASPAFDYESEACSAGRLAFRAIAGLIYGKVPSFDACLDAVRVNASIL